jgi:hypothetical protein
MSFDKYFANTPARPRRHGTAETISAHEWAIIRARDAADLERENDALQERIDLLETAVDMCRRLLATDDELIVDLLDQLEAPSAREAVAA